MEIDDKIQFLFLIKTVSGVFFQNKGLNKWFYFFDMLQTYFYDPYFL